VRDAVLALLDGGTAAEAPATSREPVSPQGGVAEAILP
jgi:hypothetical protein